MWIIYYIAQVANVDPTKIKNLPHDSSYEILAGTLNTVYFVAGALAVIVIILAGYQFSTAVYDPSKIAIAKNALLYAVVGLVVIIMAFFITQFVMGKF